MSKIKSIEQQIETLSPEDLVKFRAWHASFDAQAWDAQFTADVKAGKPAPWLTALFTPTRVGNRPPFESLRFCLPNQEFLKSACTTCR